MVGSSNAAEYEMSGIFEGFTKQRAFVVCYHWDLFVPFGEWSFLFRLPQRKLYWKCLLRKEVLMRGNAGFHKIVISLFRVLRSISREINFNCLTVSCWRTTILSLPWDSKLDFRTRDPTLMHIGTIHRARRTLMNLYRARRTLKVYARKQFVLLTTSLWWVKVFKDAQMVRWDEDSIARYRPGNDTWSLRIDECSGVRAPWKESLCDFYEEDKSGKYNLVKKTRTDDERDVQRSDSPCTMLSCTSTDSLKHLVLLF